MIRCRRRMLSLCASMSVLPSFPEPLSRYAEQTLWRLGVDVHLKQAVMMRSARVDLPWSMWAMMEKLRINSMERWRPVERESATGHEMRAAHRRNGNANPALSHGTWRAYPYRRLAHEHGRALPSG